MDGDSEGKANEEEQSPVNRLPASLLGALGPRGCGGDEGESLERRRVARSKDCHIHTSGSGRTYFRFSEISRAVRSSIPRHSVQPGTSRT